MAGSTLIVVVEIPSQAWLELDTALLELAKKYPVTWQSGPRDYKISKSPLVSVTPIKGESK